MSIEIFIEKWILYWRYVTSQKEKMKLKIISVDFDIWFAIQKIGFNTNEPFEKTMVVIHFVFCLFLSNFIFNFCSFLYYFSSKFCWTCRRFWKRNCNPQISNFVSFSYCWIKSIMEFLFGKSHPLVVEFSCNKKILLIWFSFLNLIKFFLIFIIWTIMARLIFKNYS